MAKKQTFLLINKKSYSFFAKKSLHIIGQKRTKNQILFPVTKKITTVYARDWIFITTHRQYLDNVIRSQQR